MFPTTENYSNAFAFKLKFKGRRHNNIEEGGVVALGMAKGFNIRRVEYTGDKCYLNLSETIIQLGRKLEH